MSKKKNPGRMYAERELAKIMNELKNRNFQSEEELQDYMNKLMKKNPDEIPHKKNKKYQAQDLVYEAYDASITEGKKLIKKAQELDPDNADAYNYLAENEKDINKAIILYEKAIKAGEKSLGKKFFKEEKGHFWSLIETRPYMRAKAGLAQCLYLLGKTDEAIKMYEVMLELNPNDNQGVRYQLSTMFLERNYFGKFERLHNLFNDEISAVWAYNYALYCFKKEGKSRKTVKALKKAWEGNIHVTDYLLGYKELPEEIPQYIGFGDENEAVSYVIDNWRNWDHTEGSLDWLYDFKQQRLNMN